jgi:mRNA-degrading endonuclease RelE of RelBE toxin-antitoxin system
MYKIELKPRVIIIFDKLSKKERSRLLKIRKKIISISKNPFASYKFLKKPLQGINRVHIDKHFVLTFRIDHSKRRMIIEDFDHHDKIYL